MKKNVDISVSTDPIEDFQNIVEYAKSMQGVADFLHCDIMNDNFVKKNNYDFSLVKEINDNSAIMLDVHLMQAEPTDDIPKYLAAGANIVTVHYEAFDNKQDLVRALEFIRQNKALAGLSLKPNTPFKDVRSFAFGCDLVLVMGVEPGESGQQTLPEMIERVKEIDEFRRNNNLRFKIEFDGGVNPQNAAAIVENGADILVSGNYVFSSENRAAAVQTLKNAANSN